jgi:ankyrin repeat protein
MIPLDEIKERASRSHVRSLEPWFEQGGPPAEMLAACVLGDTNAARALIVRDPSLSTIPSGEVTPLRLAASYGHCELIECLLDHGARHDISASHRLNFPLHLSAWHGHSDAVATLIRRGANINAGDRQGFTPLLVSARQQNPKVIRLLAEAGADLEARAECGTALQYALYQDSRAVVEELVKQGANVNAETIPQTLLYFCIRTEDEWPLCDLAEGARPLYLAVCRCSPEVVELLLDHGAEIDALSFGWSALHAAAVKPDRQMVELLLRRGADPYVRSNVNSPLGVEYNHRTPLDLLAGFRRSAQLLHPS